MSEVRRYLVLTKDEDKFMQRLLTNTVVFDFMTVQEFVALNNLRRKFNLPEIDGMDNEFICKCSNCFKGCEG